MKIRVVTSNMVTTPGSPPDIDTDYHTGYIEQSIQHARDLYGEANVAKIGTFQTYKPKASFKKLASLYSMPFADSNRLSGMLPDSNVDYTFEDVYDEYSPLYPEFGEFRSLATGPEWRKVVDSARHLTGRISANSIHPCGVIISSHNLDRVVPIRYTENGEAVTQWEYSECESIGLIKIDFLKLDAIDLIQNTVKNIIRAGKKPPNMIAIAEGDMDDPKTYELFSAGNTFGVFQMGGEGVRELLRSMKPKSIHDIAATTALYRPGPMGMNSHTIYAERASGRQKMGVPIHEDFKGSPLEEILGLTYNVLVYQEQIMEIANRIAGFTLLEGDKLRKAVAKKKMDLMFSLQEKFVNGAMANGYSKEAVNLLWDTIVVFGSYGFNSAHSYGYAIVAYQCAYLKANYPIEFMAARIQQKHSSLGEMRELLKECKSMGITVGPVDINRSDYTVAPVYRKESQFDIVLGFNSIKAISDHTAREIVRVRNEGGDFQSVLDMLTRFHKAGIGRADMMRNLSMAGAFDALGVTRKGAYEGLSRVSDVLKKQASRGLSSSNSLSGELTLEMPDTEWDHLTKMKHEANSIGLYLSGHPCANFGPGKSLIHTADLKTLIPGGNTENIAGFGSNLVTAGITDIMVKTTKSTGQKQFTVTIDDGTGFATMKFDKNLNRAFTKWLTQQDLKAQYLKGATEVAPEVRRIIMDDSVEAIEPPEQNMTYCLEVKTYPESDYYPARATIVGFRPVLTDSNGALPIRIRLNEDTKTSEKEKVYRALPRAIESAFPGEVPIFAGRYRESDIYQEEPDPIFEDAIHAIDAGDEEESVEETQGQAVMYDLFGNPVQVQTSKKKAKPKKAQREWPPRQFSQPDMYLQKKDIHRFLTEIPYVDTKRRCQKNSVVDEQINQYIGIEEYDMGAYQESA